MHPTRFVLIPFLLAATVSALSVRAATRSAFLPLPAAETAAVSDRSESTLPRMLERARELGPQATFIFDLDETIVDSTARRFLSILDAFDGFCRKVGAHPDCRVRGTLRLEDLHRQRNRYEVEKFLGRAGVHDEALVRALAEESFQIYVSGRYVVEEDRMLPGAQAFVRALHRFGARVFFVSSRPSKSMRAPTLEFLRRRGLLSELGSSALYLRRESEKSVEFKTRAAREIGLRTAESGGRVIGLFENEPKNLTAWATVFPRASAFFVLGAYDQEGTIPAKSVILEDYRY